jgi:hypothetical protein
MLSGALLKNSFQKDSIHGVFELIKERGLHSPYSEVLAAGAFSLLGSKETSPYYANIIVMIAYLFGISWFTRSLPLLLWTAVLVMFLTVPFITMGVVEFRPDIAWAVVTGFGVVWMVTNRTVFRHIGNSIFAGLLFGIALLIKPSTFVMTSLLFSGAIISRFIHSFLNREEKLNQQKKKVVFGVIAFAASLIVIAGPYYLFFWNETWNYFWDNSFGINKAVWSYKKSTVNSFLFYFAGDGWKSDIRISGSLISLLSLILGIRLFRDRPILRWKISMIWLATLATLFVNTIAGMKSPFLGGAIYGIWFFGCAYFIAEYYVTTAVRTEGGLKLFKRILIACCFLTLISYSWPRHSNWSKDRRGSQNYLNANQFMSHALKLHSDQLPKSILFVQTGPVVMEDIGLWFAFHNIQVKLDSAAFCRSEDNFSDKYRINDWIVIQEPKTMGYTPAMPCETLISNFKNILDADENYKIISSTSAMDGKKIWLYAKQNTFVSMKCTR